MTLVFSLINKWKYNAFTYRFEGMSSVLYNVFIGFVKNKPSESAVGVLGKTYAPEVSTLVFSVHTWYFWNSLVPNHEGKKKEEKKLSMFTWKAQCSDSPAIWSQWERRIWQGVFLNPRETSKAVLRAGQARQDGGAPYKNLPGRWAL